MKPGDLVVPFGNWDIPLFGEDIVIRDDDTIFWKPGHVAVILRIKTLRIDKPGHMAVILRIKTLRLDLRKGRSRLVEVLTPNGIGWCYLSEAQKIK
jgi:hypothetical protein